MAAVLDSIFVMLCRASWRFYQSAFFTISRTVGGAEYKIPIVNGIGLMNLAFGTKHKNPIFKENWVAPLMRGVFSYRSGAFIDVGVNIGKVLLALVSVDRTVRYVGFEANLNCAFYANRLIRENQLQNHVVMPLGLSRGPGVFDLKMQDSFDVSASIVQDFRPDAFYRESSKVYTAAGDHVLGLLSVGPVSIIKIDTEGAELEVLEGLAGTIAASSPVLVLEILGDAQSGVRSKLVNGLRDFLTRFDYCLYRVTSDLRLVDVDVPTLPHRLVTNESNYIALPRADRAEFEKHCSLR